MELYGASDPAVSHIGCEHGDHEYRITQEVCTYKLKSLNDYLAIDPPVAHAHNPMPVCSRFRIVRNHKDRLPEPLIKIPQ